MSEFSQSGVNPSGGGAASSVSVTNFPATQTITGSVGINGITFPENVNVSVTGSTGLQVHIDNTSLPVTVMPTAFQVVGTQGPQGVSGSVNVYTSGLQGVSGSVALTNWPSNVGVTGSINVYTSGLQGVSGTVTSNVTVTGSTGLMVAAPEGQPVYVAFGSTSSSVQTLTSSLTLQAVLSTNLNRRGFTVANDKTSTSTIFLAMGYNATTGSYDVPLVPGAYFESPFGWQGTLTAIADVLPGAFHVSEKT
jgi:hypothetical protein